MVLPLLLAALVGAANAQGSDKVLLLDVGLVRVAAVRPGTDRPWDPPQDKPVRDAGGVCSLAQLAVHAGAVAAGLTTGVGGAAIHFLGAPLAKRLCERAVAAPQGGRPSSMTDPDVFVRIVASPEVSYRSPTVVDALSHVFHFRVALPVDAIPNAGIELYVQNDSGRGDADSQEVIGSLRLRRKELLAALEGDGLLRLADKDGGLERIEVAVSEDDPKGQHAGGALDVSLATFGRVGGVEINAGDIVQVAAAGEYELEGNPVTPAGIRTTEDNIADPVLSRGPHGAAFAAIGDHGHVVTVFTGPCRRFVAPNPGVLIVGVNDQRRPNGPRMARKSVRYSYPAGEPATAGRVQFEVQVTPPTAEEWRTGGAAGRCEVPAVAMARPAADATTSAGQQAPPVVEAPPATQPPPIVEATPPPAPTPLPGPAPVGSSSQWSGAAAAAVQSLMQVSGPNIAASMQRILHPTGNSPVLRGYQFIPVAGGLVVRITTQWRGAWGAWYVTAVDWGLSPQGHVRASVISDTARVRVGVWNLQRLVPLHRDFDGFKQRQLRQPHQRRQGRVDPS